MNKDEVREKLFELQMKLAMSKLNSGQVKQIKEDLKEYKKEIAKMMVMAKLEEGENKNDTYKRR